MKYFAPFIGLLLLGLSDSRAQNQVRHTPPTVLERNQQHELTFEVPGMRSDEAQEALLFYRYSGDTSYKQRETQLRQGTFTSRLSIDQANASGVEYYFRVRTRDGNELTYPAQDAASNPVQVEVVDPSTDPDTTALNELAEQISPSILSPKPDAEVTPDEAILAVTFFYEDTSIEQGRFRVYLDGHEVTDSADVSSHFVSYQSSQIGLGEHTARVTYQGNEQQYQLVEWGFTVAEAPEAQTASPLAQSEPEDYVSGRAQFSSQNQSVGQSGSDIARGRLRLEGREGIVRYNVNATLTSEQSSRLQPRNRYGAELLFENWGELRMGDSYPSLSRLTLAGRRVRGVDARLELFGENLNAEFLYGRLRRSINNQYRTIRADYDTLGSTADGPIVDSTYTLPFANQGRGTHQRSIIGGRLSAGDETPIQWGLNALRVRDDTTSLSPISDFTDARTHSQTLISSLDPADKQYLDENPTALSVSGSNAKPKDNFSASSDLRLRLDDNNIQLDAEFGVSLLNENIRGGVLTQEKADDIGVDLNQSTEDLLSRISWLLIINEQMSTLPFRFEEQADGENELTPFVPSGIFGGQSRASFNYLDHQVQVRYRWFGPNYVSLANSTLRQDLQGLGISDRFQLFENRLYVTLGYETLKDNVVGTKDATTTTETYRTNLSWYPVQRNLPRISVNARLRDRGNGVARNNPEVPAGQEMSAVRNIRRITSDSIQVIPNPVQSFTTQLSGSITQQFTTGSVINDATLNVSYLRTNNEVFEYGGTKNLSYSLNVRNRFSNLPLDTQVGVNVNQTESSGGLSSLDILGASVGGTAYLLDRRLQVSGTLALTVNSRTARRLEVNDNGTESEFVDDYYEPSDTPTEQESNSYVFNLSTRYELAPRHSILANADFNNVVAQDGRSLPNDRILRIQYVYDF